MGRIRRKRTKYTWLPTLGGIAVSGDTKYGVTYFGAEIEADAPAFGPSDLYVTPIVPDQTEFVEDASLPSPEINGATLRDFTEGQDWLCKRIVGKLCVGMQQHQDAIDGNSPPYAIVGAGFYVGRADDTNQNVPDTQNQEIDPLGLRNVRQPWMWRRTWLLTNASASPPLGAEPLAWTHLDNGSFDSMRNGFDLDCKMARRIRREERLFFVINAYGLSNIHAENDGHWPIPGKISFNLDYRVLGAMRRSNNRSTF